MSGTMNFCDAVREKLHAAFDEDGPVVVPDAVRAHLEACAACREFLEELGALRSALHELPAVPLPPAALDAVWRRTVHAPSRDAVRLAPVWARAAAAAVAATALIATTWIVMRPATVSNELSDAALLHAEAQADMVFGYTARALDATRIAAAERIVASKISPAVRGASAGAPTVRRD